MKAKLEPPINPKQRKLTPAQKKNLQEWIAALRSGEYKQARETLSDSKGRMCCLGVACDIAGSGWWWMATEGKDDWIYFEGGMERRLTLVGSMFIKALVPKRAFDGKPPIHLSRKFGLFVDEDEKDEVDLLVDLNDHEKYSFKEIANWLELNVLNVRG